MMEISDKVKSGTSTQEEELALLEHLNKGMDEFRDFIREINTNKE